MKVKIWGVRGSLPSPLLPVEVEKRISNAMKLFLSRGGREESEVDPFLKTLPPGLYGGFGGNTPSVEVTSPGSHLIIDGGSGIRPLGQELMKGPCGRGEGKVDILMTHFHWDHLIGFPFFTPLYVKGNEIRFHAVQDDLQNVISTIFRKPFFPVDFGQLQSTIRFNLLAPRQTVKFGDMSVTPYQLDHPDPCWGYRIEQGGKVFSHCVDSETTRFSREELGLDLPLYQGVDLLIFDGQYGLVESIHKETWGHGSAMVGLDLAKREGIRRVVVMHHDPASADEKVQAIEEQTKSYYDKQKKQDRRNGEVFGEVEWSFAREGMEIEL